MVREHDTTLRLQERYEIRANAVLACGNFLQTTGEMRTALVADTGAVVGLYIFLHVDVAEMDTWTCNAMHAVPERISGQDHCGIISHTP